MQHSRALLSAAVTSLHAAIRRVWCQMLSSGTCWAASSSEVAVMMTAGSADPSRVVTLTKTVNTVPSFVSAIVLGVEAAARWYVGHGWDTRTGLWGAAR
jgi:hypothetical protein